MARFTTSAQAQAAGYSPARAGRVAKHRGFEIRITDVSEYPSFGYDYAVTVLRDWWFDEPSPMDAAVGAFTGQHFASSEFVSLTEARNHGGGIGAVSKMFAPGALEGGIASARQAIDAWYDVHPDAAAHQARAEAEDAERAVRRRAKDAARLQVRLQRRGLV